MTKLTINLNLSDAFLNKDILPPYDKRAFGDSFYPQEITLDEWVQHVVAGKAFTIGCYEGNSRRKETFKSSPMLGLDFDDNVSVEDCKHDPLLSQYAYLLYPTASSSPECHKTRAMFVLSEPVTDYLEWERLQRGLIWQYQNLNPDGQCKDAARLFYGSTQTGHDVSGLIMPIEIARGYAAEMEAEIGKIEPARSDVDNEAIRKQNTELIKGNYKQQRYYRYATQALDNMGSSLSSMSEGSRNSTLNKYAYACGHMVAASMISFSECHGALYSAALSSGLGKNEIENTLGRAIRQGMSDPTNLAELDRKWDEKSKQRAIEHKRQINAEYQAKKAELAQEETLATGLFSQAIELITNERSKHLNELRESYEQGNYQSWYGQELIPLAHINALLNLCDTRNNTVLVWGKMDKAFKRGQLKPFDFTAVETAAAIDVDIRTVRNAFETMLDFNLIQFQEYPIVLNTSLETVFNSSKRGRKAKHYCIVDNRAMYEILPDRLGNALELYFAEKYCKHTLSVLTPELQQQMGFDTPKLREKSQAVFTIAHLQDKMSAQAKRALEREMNGDEHFVGWFKALRNNFAIDLDWDNCKSIRDVRALILEHMIKIRPQNSQTDLRRIAGCSSATLNSIYHDYNIATTRQYEEVELDVSTIGKDLRPVIRQFQQKHRGTIQLISFKREVGKWYEVPYKDAALHYATTRYGIKNSPNYPEQTPIVKVYMRVFCPSVQHKMTADEIAARDKKLADEAEKEVDSSTPKQVVTPVTRVTVKPSREWRNHDATFIYQQTRVLTHCFTPFALVGNAIQDKGGQVLYSSRDMSDITRWIMDNIDIEGLPLDKKNMPKPLRTSVSLRPKHQQNELDKNDLMLEQYFDNCRMDEIKVKNEEDEWLEIWRKADMVYVPEF